MKSTFPQCGNLQRGVALLVALLVVALATVLIAGLLDRGGLAALAHVVEHVGAD